MPRKSVYTGGCLCGAVRFEVNASALNPHTCSCKMCQRHSGALTTAWVEFPEESVAWTGSKGKPETFRTSDYSSRAFCPRCGSTLGAIDDEPVVALLLGAFDDVKGEELIPKSHSYSECRPSWWHIETKSN